MPPRTIFEYELKKLKDDVAAMGLRVEETYVELFLALINGNKEEIIEIMESDHIVNDMQRGIEARCLSLIAKQQPVARDLRMITASLKVVTDIERVGDHVSDMAELMLRLNLSPLSSYSSHLEPMIKAAKDMLHSAVDVFVERNEEAAKSVIASDDVVDDFFNKVKQDLIEYLKKGTKNADECIDVLMLAKYLEKIGDHAVNIAEWELFQETGEIGDIRLL